MRKLYFILILIIPYIHSCQPNKSKEKTSQDLIDSVSFKNLDPPQTSTFFQDSILQEYFVDSTEIGVKGKNKIELFQYRNDSVYAVINFYSKEDSLWEIKNTFTFLKDGITSLETSVSDYTGNGFKDATFKSSIAGRGANEIRTLLIYNTKEDNLTHIKNSDIYANLQYNKDLKCIDAFNVYGGSMSYFLNIVGDSLKPFASVELYEGLTISEYDKNGKETVIHSDTSIKHSYGRYKSYNPLIEYEDY